MKSQKIKKKMYRHNTVENNLNLEIVSLNFDLVQGKTLNLLIIN